MDKVKPLKIETSIDGTQSDPFPVETNPEQDYLASKGIAFENLDTRLLDLDGLGNIQFKDATETAYMQLWKLRRAIFEIFDPTGSDLVSLNSEDAIKEVRIKISTSASPGFSFGRSGTVSKGAYLQNETVPSNVSGRWVYINNAVIREVYISNETLTTFTIEVYSHDGNEVNLTLLGSVTVTSARGGAFSVNWPVDKNKQIAVRLSTASDNTAKNLVCGLSLNGTY